MINRMARLPLRSIQINLFESDITYAKAEGINISEFLREELHSYLTEWKNGKRDTSKPLGYAQPSRVWPGRRRITDD